MRLRTVKRFALKKSQKNDLWQSPDHGDRHPVVFVPKEHDLPNHLAFLDFSAAIFQFRNVRFVHSHVRSCCNRTVARIASVPLSLFF